jgi:hypothetical protein
MFWEGAAPQTYDKSFDAAQQTKLQGFGDPDCG